MPTSLRVSCQARRGADSVGLLALGERRLRRLSLGILDGSEKEVLQKERRSVDLAAIPPDANRATGRLLRSRPH